MVAFWRRLPPDRERTWLRGSFHIMDVEELRRRVPTEGTFEGLLGTVYDSYEVGEIGGHLTVLESMLNQSGDTPLGVYATVAEGAASVGRRCAYGMTA